MKAVIFDLDGVIVATDELHYNSWRRLATEEGLVFDRDVNARMLGRSREDSLAILLDGRRMGNTKRADCLRRKQTYFLAQAELLTPGDTLPGVVTLLDEARRNGLACAVASSSRNAKFVLNRLRLSDHFAVVIDGNMGLPPKPAPDIFIKAAQTLGVVPRQCLVLEDSEAGMDAARTGGFPAMIVRPGIELSNSLQLLFNATR